MRETTGLDFDSYVRNEEWGREQEITAQRERELEEKERELEETERNQHMSSNPTETDKQKSKYKGNKYFDKVPDPLFDDDEV